LFNPAVTEKAQRACKDKEGMIRHSANIAIIWVYALDFNPAFPGRKVTRKQVLKAMQGHILAQGEVMGRYRRAKN